MIEVEIILSIFIYSEGQFLFLNYNHKPDLKEQNMLKIQSFFKFKSMIAKIYFRKIYQDCSENPEKNIELEEAIYQPLFLNLNLC